MADPFDPTADKVVATVRASWAMAKTALDETPSSSWFSLTDSGAYALRASQATLERIRQSIETWATTERGWAGAGQRADGTAYDWARWLTWGQDLGNQALSTASLQVSSDDWVLAAQQAAPGEAIKTAGEAAVKNVTSLYDKVSKCVADPGACVLEIPWWVWGAGVAALGLLVLSNTRFNVGTRKERTR
jgi:hypothetical protein